MDSTSPNPILLEMMQSGNFSDLKFLCGGQEFKVHRAVVCQQSPMIKAAIQGKFKETDTLAMDNFQPDIVTRLVEFMYTGDYSEQEVNRSNADNTSCEPCAARGEETTDVLETEMSEDPLRTEIDPAAKPSTESIASASLFMHIQVNSIGDYYGVDRLVSLANSKIKRLVRDDSNDQSWVTSLPSAIEAASQSTGDGGLMEILACAAGTNISTLLKSDQFVGLDAVTDFSIKIMQQCAEQNDARLLELEQCKLRLEEAEAELELTVMEVSVLKGTLGVLNRTAECRNCGSSFECSISPAEKILRCAKCRCKHHG